jgi:ribosomal protein S18 acetylase RimI-like enzyme
MSDAKQFSKEVTMTNTKSKNILTTLQIRPLNETDNLVELTELLHLAYKKMEDEGFRFLAAHQNVETTKKRIKDAECFVAIFENKIIGTITYYSQKNTRGNDWYDQPFVSNYGQFAVDPAFQQYGVGARLIDLAEKLAMRDKAAEVTIDTAEGATELISYYQKRGYRFVGYTQWEVTDYRSVMLSKNLNGL